VEHLKRFRFRPQNLVKPGPGNLDFDGPAGTGIRVNLRFSDHSSFRRRARRGRGTRPSCPLGLVENIMWRQAGKNPQASRLRPLL